MITVFLVDDHVLVRLGLRRLLDDARGIKVIGEASTGEECLRLIRNKSPDVVLLDVKMPGLGGLETTRRLKHYKTDLKVIAITSFIAEPYPSRMLQAGASGYITKDCTAEELIAAIRSVFKGERYLSPAVAKNLALKNIEDVDLDASPFESLSDREIQIAIMITSGFRVQDVAEQLSISTKTVNSYRYRFFAKLKVNNDVELTHLALQYNLLDSPQVVVEQLKKRGKQLERVEQVDEEEN